MHKVTLKLSLIFIGFTGLLSASVEARNYTSKECRQLVNHVNKDLPEVVDSVTVLKNSTCLVTGDIAEFTYVYELDLSRISIKSIPAQFRRNTINSFCSNPDTQVFFRGLTKVKNDYYDKGTGKFFGRIEITKSDC